MCMLGLVSPWNGQQIFRLRGTGTSIRSARSISVSMALHQAGRRLARRCRHRRRRRARVVDRDRDRRPARFDDGWLSRNDDRGLDRDHGCRGRRRGRRRDCWFGLLDRRFGCWLGLLDRHYGCRLRWPAWPLAPALPARACWIRSSQLGVTFRDASPHVRPNLRSTIIGTLSETASQPKPGNHLGLFARGGRELQRVVHLQERDDAGLLKDSSHPELCHPCAEALHQRIERLACSGATQFLAVPGMLGIGDTALCLLIRTGFVISPLRCV